MSRETPVILGVSSVAAHRHGSGESRGGSNQSHGATDGADTVAPLRWFAGLRPSFLVTLLLRSKLFEEGGLQELAVVSRLSNN